MNQSDFRELCSQGKKEFVDLDLSKVDMWDYHDLQEMTFDNCNLSEKEFYYSKLNSTSFKRCNLSKVRFVNPDLEKTSFYGANLQNAFFDFTSTYRHSNVFIHRCYTLTSNSTFTKAFYIFLAFLFVSCVLPVLFAGYIISAIFWGGILYGCALICSINHISYRNVDFRKADLTGARFGGAFIHGANLAGATMPNGKMYAPYHYFFIWD